MPTEGLFPFTASTQAANFAHRVILTTDFTPGKSFHTYNRGIGISRRRVDRLTLGTRGPHIDRVNWILAKRFLQDQCEPGQIIRGTGPYVAGLACAM